VAVGGSWLVVVLGVFGSGRWLVFAWLGGCMGGLWCRVVFVGACVGVGVCVVWCGFGTGGVLWSWMVWGGGEGGFLRFFFFVVAMSLGCVGLGGCWVGGGRWVVVFCWVDFCFCGWLSRLWGLGVLVFV